MTFYETFICVFLGSVVGLACYFAWDSWMMRRRRRREEWEHDYDVWYPDDDE